MRLTAIFLLAAMLQVTAHSTAQTVTYEAKKTPLVQVFAAVKQQTGYVFFYSTEDLQGTTPVTVKLHQVPMKEALEAILANEPLTFTIQGNTIAITRKTIKAGGNADNPPPGEVHGVVRDESGKPLAGVNIVVKGSRKGVSTGEDGTFLLKGVGADAVLVVSSVGYEVQEIKVSVQTEVVVQLRVAVISMQDAVVNKGYYSTTKRLNTGNVSTVKSEEIEKQPVENVLSAIEGRVPGMFILQNTGNPGGGFSIQIRGQNSIANGNDPLYIIDGVPYASEILLTLNGQLSGGNPLTFINPLDIERIDVLKDADATAIYGSRAANGAVLITTKKGREGATRVDLNFSDGQGKVAHFIPVLNTQQYLEMRHEAYANDGVTPTRNGTTDLLFWDTTRYTNWQKVLLGNAALFRDAQASISGGNANTTFQVGANYHKETTVEPVMLPGEGADQKGALHMNLNDVSVNKRFHLQLSVNYDYQKNTVQAVGFPRVALILPPDAPPPFNPDRSLNWDPLSPGAAGTFSNNPYAQLLIGYKGITSNLVGNMMLGYIILPNLELKASLGYTDMRTDENYWDPSTAGDPATNPQPYSEFNTNMIRSWIVEPQANYSIKLGQGNLSALIGGTFEQSQSSNVWQMGTGYSNDALLPDLQAASTVSIVSDINRTYKYDAIFGRLSYDWNSKYLINLTGRRDGSSRFGPAEQFSNFGAIGLGWVFSKESFMQHWDRLVSFGKLRVSYGTTGSDQIPDYEFMNLYTITSYPYQGAQGLYPANLYNPYLEWELTKKIEGGLELGLFKDRISLTLSYYRNRSGNQLVGYPLSEVSGFGYIQSNLPALVQNSGQEYSLTTTNVRTKHFSWKSDFNLTIPRNKLIAYPNLATSSYASTLVIGKPITISKCYRFEGVNDSTGIFQYASAKGGTTAAPNSSTDRMVIINTAPQFYGGFGNDFSFRGITLSIFLHFVKQLGQNYVYNNSYSSRPGTRVNQSTAVLDRWQKPGDVKVIEKFTENTASQAGKAANYIASADVAHADASFIRLKNVSLSYELPDAWKRRMKIRGCMVYFHAQNLLVFTKYNGFDPETQGQAMPPLRVLTGGIRFSL